MSGGCRWPPPPPTCTDLGGGSRPFPPGPTTMFIPGGPSRALGRRDDPAPLPVQGTPQEGGPGEGVTIVKHIRGREAPEESMLVPTGVPRQPQGSLDSPGPAGVAETAPAHQDAQSCPTLLTPLTVTRQAPLSWNSPNKNTGVVCQLLLQGIFPTQGSNSHLLH